MGLDSVELVMAYEEAFKIEISDAEAEELQTPAHVIALVQQKYATRLIGEQQRKVCLSQASFYRLRRAFCAELTLSRSALRPDTELARLLPHKRATMWEALHLRTGLEYWPSLKTPKWLWLVSFLAGPFVYGVWLGTMGNSIPGAVIGMLLSIPIGMILILCTTKPLQTDLPFTTLGELAKDVGTFQFATLAGERVPSREGIAAAIREITLEQLGISPEQYREDAEFIRDFGVG